MFERALSLAEPGDHRQFGHDLAVSHERLSAKQALQKVRYQERVGRGDSRTSMIPGCKEPRPAGRNGLSSGVPFITLPLYLGFQCFIATPALKSRLAPGLALLMSWVMVPIGQ